MSYQKSVARARFAAAVAAGAVAAGVIGPAAPATAQPFGFHVAVAYSFRSDVGGVGRGQTEDSARIEALKACQDKGGNHCVWFGATRNICIALAVLGAKEWVTATGSSLAAAEQQALADNPGSRIVASGCALPQPTTTKPRPTIVPPAPAEQ
jgi:hypothetical protein